MKTKVELSDVFLKFSTAYKAEYGGYMMPSQFKAMDDISNCMTEKMGGGRYQCNDCRESFWSYHGCRNRSCPKCHGRQTVEWLEKRLAEIFSCEYFHVIATVPHQLNNLFSGNQKIMYSILMKAAADSIKELSMDKKYVGGEVGILSVLHTWTATIKYHPHVHMLVTGGGIDKDRQMWHEASYGFLVPVKKLSPLISKKFSKLLQDQHQEIYDRIDKKVWHKEWCSYCKSYGRGNDAVLKYLARYVFRIAITNARILNMDDKKVTFRYKDNNTWKMKVQTISGVEFSREPRQVFSSSLAE